MSLQEKLDSLKSKWHFKTKEELDAYCAQKNLDDDEASALLDVFLYFKNLGRFDVSIKEEVVDVAEKAMEVIKTQTAKPKAAAEKKTFGEKLKEFAIWTPLNLVLGATIVSVLNVAMEMDMTISWIISILFIVTAVFAAAKIAALIDEEKETPPKTEAVVSPYKQRLSLVLLFILGAFFVSLLVWFFATGKTEGMGGATIAFLFAWLFIFGIYDRRSFWSATRLIIGILVMTAGAFSIWTLLENEYATIAALIVGFIMIGLESKASSESDDGGIGGELVDTALDFEWD